MIMLISTIGKIIGFVREQVIAGYFGATQAVDAYVAAYSVPLFILATVTSALYTSFIPVFMRWRSERGEREAWVLVGTLLKVTGIGLGALSATAYIAAPLIVRLQAPDFSPEAARLTVTLLRIIIPGTVFSGLASIIVAILNAHHRFGWSALSPALLSAGTVVGAVALVPRYGLSGLAYASLFGMLLQFGALLWQIRARQFPIVWIGKLIHPGLKQLLLISGPIFVSTFFMQLYLFVNRWLAIGLEPGSLASLNYASKLVALPIGLFVSAMATAIYPTLSELYSKSNEDGFRGTLASGFRMLLVVIVPAAVGLFVLREPIVRVAFQRGAFDSAATARTSTALAYAAFGLIGQACISLLNNAFYSRGDASTPVKVSMIFVVVNTTLSVILAKPLAVGGLALATTISQFVSMVLLVATMARRHAIHFATASFTVKLAVSAAIMGATAHQVYRMSRDSGLALPLVLSAIAGAIVYFALVLLLRVGELASICRLVKRKLRVNLVA